MSKNKKQKWINIESRTNLAGVQYSDYQLVCGSLKPGTIVDLIGEPCNLHDNMAIRVEYSGILLGYIPTRTTLQSELWRYHKLGCKLNAIITAFNKTNPTWCMITVQCIRTECRDAEVVESSLIKF